MKNRSKSKLIFSLIAVILLASAIAVPLATHAKSANPSQVDPMWSTTGNILLPRYSFRATTLPNGKVLIEGGFAPGSYTTDSELYDPATGVWTQTGSLNQGRGEHSATLLQDGRVLVAGGYAGPVLNSAEIYDPATGTWTLTGSMSQVRTRHAATLLQNGMVFVAGGWDGSPISGAEIYDPATGSWSSAGNMFIPRADGAAVQLPNGKVLVAGGDFANSNGITGESELYDPATNSWSATGSMNVARGGFDAVLLPNGKVLAVGGSDSTGGATATAELYDPTTGTWTLTGSMQQARNLGLGLQALLLVDGTVFIAGGDTAGTSEIYDPSTGTWGSLTSMVTPHCGGVTALLADGRPLIAGGSDCASNLTTVTELYSSSPSYGKPILTSKATSTPPAPTTSRYMATVDTTTLMSEGQAQAQSGESGIVVLDFGQPLIQNNVYGSCLFISKSCFRSTAQIASAAEAFLKGYAGAASSGQFLTLAIGTSNYGKAVTNAHGQAWASMVNQVGQWIASQGFTNLEQVAGASDIEMGFNSATTTRAWVDGYNSNFNASLQFGYFDYGDAAGCPTSSTTTDGSCNKGWHQSDVVYVSWDVRAAYPLPEIYTVAGSNVQQANQWYSLSLYSYNHPGSYGHMFIEGSFTQHGACHSPGHHCNSSVDNTPQQGWQLLYNALNADTKTAQPLPFSSDITYAN